MKPLCPHLVALVLLSGCVTAKDACCIFELKTEKALWLKKQSACPEDVISVNAETFRIFNRTTAGFEVRDLHYDGSLSRRVSGGQFSAHILRYYGLFTEGFAVSRDASRIAYCDLPSGELRLVSVREGSEQVLLTNVATNEMSVAWLEWRSDSELIIAISAWVGERPRFLMLNVDTKRVMFELPVCARAQYSPNNALSHDKRYLAYQEFCGGDSSYGSLRVYDIAARKQVATVVARHSIVQTPHWSESDQTFVYVDGSDLMEYSLARQEPKCIRSYPKGGGIHLFAYERGKVFHTVVARRQRLSESPLRIYDIGQQQEQQISGVRLNGRVSVSPGGKFVITSWGY